MTIIYSTASRTDLLEIGEWIAQENNVRAESFIDELQHACETLVHMPRAFPLLPLRSETPIRRKPYKSYLIFYTVSGEQVEIARIIHGARDYMKILFPR